MGAELTETAPQVGVISYQPGGFALLAVLGGRLVDAGGCLGLERGSGSVPLAVPVDSLLSNGSDKIFEYRGASYTVGDEISFGGGLVEAKEVKSLRVPPNCKLRGIIAVMNDE